MLRRPCLAFCALSAAASFLASCEQGSQTSQDHKRPVERNENLRELISEAISSGKNQVVVPPGRYRLKPVNGHHLLFRGLKNFTVTAENVELVCSETTRAITIEDCENFTLSGITIDYDPLPYTQALITGISEDKSVLEVEIPEGFPDVGLLDGTMEIFNPLTGELRGRLTYFGTKIEMTGPRRAKFIKSNPHTDIATEQIGDIAIVRVDYAPGGRIPHAIMAKNCSGLTLERVTVYASNSFAFYENGSSDSRYIDCRVDRRSNDDDLVKRSVPRMRSSNADAFHSKNAQKGPLYSRCVARFMGDDGIAINGDFHLITEISGTSLRVLAKHEMTLRPGEPVQILNPDGEPVLGAVVVSVTRSGVRTEQEFSLVRALRLHGNLTQTALLESYSVELDRGVNANTGALICNANAMGNGFRIEHCEIANTRARGMLIKAGEGQIVGNKLTGVIMTGILVKPEPSWLEAGIARNLLIADNTLKKNSGIGIAVTANNNSVSTNTSRMFDGITIKNNSITGGVFPGILVTSAKNITIRDNRVTPDSELKLFSWEIGYWAQALNQPIVLRNTD